MRLRGVERAGAQQFHGDEQVPFDQREAGEPVGFALRRVLPTLAAFAPLPALSAFASLAAFALRSRDRGLEVDLCCAKNEGPDSDPKLASERIHGFPLLKGRLEYNAIYSHLQLARIESMILCIQGVINDVDLGRLRTELRKGAFRDGRETAGWHARLAKDNEQADPGDEGLRSAAALVAERLSQHELFALAVRPKRVAPIMISRYAEGRCYGTHVDDALMGGLRSDVSFTVFLSAPSEYGGGELVLERPEGEQPFKLEAGDAVVYPSTSLHRVNRVERGTRLVAVGWAQSLVRLAEHRELLFDLDSARRALFAKQGKSAEFDLLSKCLSNLLREWAEP
ncbi:MAG: Fe2+-dependent dioxygenase [Geminicoccales bacterium]